MTIFVPDTGEHYLCIDDPRSNTHFQQVKIIGWSIKSENTQPIPVTAFGLADMRGDILVSEDNGTTQGVFFFLPNGPFLRDYNEAKRVLTHLTNGGKL